MLCLQLKKLVPQVLLLWIKVCLGWLLTLFRSARALHSSISCLVLLRLCCPCCNPWAISRMGKTEVIGYILWYIWLLDYLFLRLLLLVNKLRLWCIGLSIRGFSFSFIRVNRPICLFKRILNNFALAILKHLKSYLLLAWSNDRMFNSHWTWVCLDKRFLLMTS